MRSLRPNVYKAVNRTHRYGPSGAGAPLGLNRRGNTPLQGAGAAARDGDGRFAGKRRFDGRFLSPGDAKIVPFRDNVSRET